MIFLKNKEPLQILFLKQIKKEKTQARCSRFLKLSNKKVLIKAVAIHLKSLEKKDRYR